MMIERTNTDLDYIDYAIDELYTMLEDKVEGVGVIRVIEGQVISEYHASLDSAKEYPGVLNLVMTMAKDKLDRKTLRKVCYQRYEEMRIWKSKCQVMKLKQ